VDNITNPAIQKSEESISNENKKNLPKKPANGGIPACDNTTKEKIKANVVFARNIIENSVKLRILAPEYCLRKNSRIQKMFKEDII